MRLSVVVTIVDAGDALERCLRALAAQDGATDLEVVVPWDDTIPGMADVTARFPSFRFLPLGTVETVRPASGAAGQHELYDRRRSAGLLAATGELVAILEDRGVPRRDWTRTMIAIHARLPHAAIGGAIENGCDAPLNWAVFFCDFGRYQPPFEAGPRKWVSDVNVGYKRRALDATLNLWRERYHETTVHWALLRAGETLYLTPDPDLVVDQMRGRLRFGALLAERFAWGRLFACTRARDMSVPRRLAYALGSPLVPIVLTTRQVLLPACKRRQRGPFLAALPAFLVLAAAWAAGEAAGYLTSEA
jgi:hypothetical protein